MLDVELRQGTLVECAMDMGNIFSMRAVASLIALMFALALSPPIGAAEDSSILTYHGDNSRSGNFVVPALSWDKARSVRRNFPARPQQACQLRNTRARRRNLVTGRIECCRRQAVFCDPK